jgi:membrane protease YdiL (CAAX protease family)
MACARSLGEWRDVAGFLALAFGISWALWLPALLSGGTIQKGLGWPSHFPGLIGPAVAALAMVWIAGPAARADLRARLFAGLGRPGGWALALAPGVAVGVLLLAGAGAGWEGLMRHTGLPVLPVLAVLALAILINGFGEETGWRGFLLPRLQRAVGTVTGCLLTGAIWAAWHLPLFFVQASYLALSPWALVFGFGLGMMAAGLVLGHVAARAGIAGAAVWHALYNMGVATELGGPAAQVMAGLAGIWALALLLTPAGRRAIRVPPLR